MPERPEIEAYLHALRPRVVGRTLRAVRIASFSVLRTYDPPIDAAHGRRVRAVTRLGKRIVLHLDDDRSIVIHLMVAGRLGWLDPAAPIRRRGGLAAFDFDNGSLMLTEAGTRRRASLHFVDGDGLAALDPGGAEIDDLDAVAFAERITSRRCTLKRALTDPTLLSGIGGAFADEILWLARLSPTQLTTNLDDRETARLHDAATTTLNEWVARRVEETGDGFPTDVSAFHPDMAVHGKYGRPCPACGVPIQRVVSGKRETNYCPGCQTGGKILADRAMSRLLRDDRPKTIRDLPELD